MWCTKNPYFVHHDSKSARSVILAAFYNFKSNSSGTLSFFFPFASHFLTVSVCGGVPFQETKVSVKGEVVYLFHENSLRTNCDQRQEAINHFHRGIKITSFPFTTSLPSSSQVRTIRFPQLTSFDALIRALVSLFLVW